MPRAPFRLASVLSLREAQLTLAIEEMSRLESQARALQDDLTRVDHLQETALARSVSPEPTRAADLCLVAQYLAFLEEQEQRLRQEVGRLENQLAHARQAVIERHQSVDILNRLRRRQEALQVQDERRQEQHELDEIAGRLAELRRREERR